MFASEARNICTREGTSQDWETTTMVAHSLRAEGFDASEDGTGRGTPLVPVLGKTASAAAALDRGEPVSFTVAQVATGFSWLSEVAPTITATQAGANANPAQQTGILAPVAFGWQNSAAQGDSVSEHVTPSLDKSKTPAICFSAKDHGADAMNDCSPTLRAGGHSGSHANAGVMPAVVMGADTFNGALTGDIAATMGTRGSSETASGPVLLTAMQVRRLTPRECERLQGFPATRERLTFEACLDHQSGVVSVVLSCLRWQNSASHAAAERFPPLAASAAMALSTSQASREPLAVLRVRQGSEVELLELRSRGRSIWCASNAGTQSSSRLSMPPGNIAAAVVRPAQYLALEMRAGKAASHQSIRLSIPAQSGAQSAPTFGVESGGCASDAENAALQARFTTSDLGRLVPSSASQTATWLCSVLAVISGCIPRETLTDSFCFEVEIEADYTAVPHRGKDGADGPRYKSLGNSWAVPVARWVGERIAAVEAL